MTLPKPKRDKTALIAVVGVGVGLALGLGLGVGLGANLNTLGLIPKRLACATPPPSARERFLACTVSEVVPTGEETQAMLAQRQGRAATPAWGVP